jgi:hypothetical protein
VSGDGKDNYLRKIDQGGRMPGDWNDVLPEPVSVDNEQFFDQMLKRKLTTACGIAVQLLHAMEARFGVEARDVLRELVDNQQFEARQDPGMPRDDLRSFCDSLDRGCVGTHRWVRVIEEPDQIGYSYSRCMWAEIFGDLGEPDLGHLLCAGDEPSVKAFNPDLGFQRTRVLMQGDNDCDHVFYVRDR